MFDLEIFIEKKLTDIGFDNDELSPFSASSLAKDIVSYINSRQGVFTPDAVNAMNRENNATLNNIRLVIDNNRAAVATDDESMIVRKQEGMPIAASFECLTQDGGLIYSEYCAQEDILKVYFYNADSVNFARGINPMAKDNMPILVMTVLNTNNGISPDAYQEYAPEYGMTNALDDAKAIFKTGLRRFN